MIMDLRIKVTDVVGNVSFISGPFLSRKQMENIISYLASYQRGEIVSEPIGRANIRRATHVLS